VTRRLTALALALVLALSLTGCWEAEPEPDDFWGDELPPEEQETSQREPAQISDFTLPYLSGQTFDPVTCIDGVQQTVGALLYESLFTLDASFTPQPVLCERSSCDAQALTWTFALRSAVFSDGTALTANDVLAAYRRAAESARYGARFANVASMKAQDAHTLIVTLTQANGSFPALLDIPIVKASQVADEHPLGTGPYEFHAGEDGADLTRVANWWCGDTQLSTRAKTIQVIEATSQTQLRDEFEFGDLNLACADPLLDSYGEYRCDFELWEVDNGVMVYLACNTLWSDYFKDSDVLRKALTYAIDRETLNEDNYRGMGQPSTLVTSPRSPYYNAELAEKFAYDPMKFLDAIGRFTLPKNDKGEVQKLKLLVNADDSARLRMARQIASHLTELGIPTGVLEYGTSGAVTYRHVLNANTYDIYLGQTRLSPNYDLSEFFKGYGTLSNGVLVNETLLNMAKEALSNSGNFYNLNQMVAEDGSLIPVLFGTYNIYSKRGELLDLQPSRDNVFYYTVGKTMSSILEESTG